MRILITPRSLTERPLESVPELEPLRARGWELVAGPAGRLPTEDELIDLVTDVDGWIAGVEHVSDRVLAAASHLRVIARNGVGTDAIDLDAAQRRGVEVLAARGANSRGVAELSLTLMLSALRHVPESNALLHSGGWARPLGRELAECTVGIVGFGAVGRLVAGFAAALGATVLAHDPIAPVEPELATGLDELFRDSDVISLHTPPLAGSERLVDAARLADVRPGGVLVNTARARLVDEGAVLAALEAGRLSWYAVDAFDAEPPELTPLLRHPRTIMTPHAGGYTGASLRRAVEAAVANLVTTLEA